MRRVVLRKHGLVLKKHQNRCAHALTVRPACVR